MTASAPWLDALNLPTGIQPSFFAPDSTPQRVTVMSVEGYGQDGIGHKLETKDDEGKVTMTKSVKKYATVHVLDGKDRSKVWDVLSKPAVVQIAHAIKQHGPTWAGELVLDVQTDGRGKEKEFIIRRVTAESIEAERRAEAAIAAERAKKAAAKPVGAPSPEAVAAVAANHRAEVAAHVAKDAPEDTASPPAL